LAPPRVLQVVLSLHPGGTERLVVDLVTRLHDVSPMAVCCLDDRGRWGEDLAARGIGVTALGRAPGFHPLLARRVAGAARAHGATVVHAHHYSPFVYGAVARLFGSGAGVVFTEHGRLSDAGPSPKRRTANRVLAPMAARVFAVSENVRTHLVGEGFAPEAVGVIYNGIDIGPPPPPGTRARIRAALGAGEAACVVGTIARLDAVKDLGTLIGAIAAADDARVHLVVVGDGDERAPLAQRAAGLGVAGRVHFTGYRDDARDWLAGCDIYANSSISEGVSLTILEAMAAGLPIVATAVGGTPEVVDGSCARLVPARDPRALARALLELTTDPGLRRALGAAARQRVQARFTIDRMVQDYSTVYADVSRGRHRT
jgi:glycosyltransferase involved in cell wall biosynthesis